MRKGDYIEMEGMTFYAGVYDMGNKKTRRVFFNICEDGMVISEFRFDIPLKNKVKK